MSAESTRFIHVIYIASTPQKVFEAITRPEIASRYWGMRTSRTGSPARAGSTCAPTIRARSSWSARW